MFGIAHAFIVVLLMGTAALLTAQGPQPAATAFERLKAMEGEWVDVNGAFGTKGAVVATYKVSNAGNTVIESFPVGTPHEMMTVYHRDGTSLVLTHYCSGGTQPRMRAKDITGNVMEFAYDGGSNIDVTKTSHMHHVRWEFLSNDEVKADWHNWSNGRDDGHVGRLHIRRKR
ncbi:MAG TPA: hypothetical protein VEC39_08235 [Vicinamibacterales bacterium]|nr:hypothetical protein [Vicinamibacterales bacterium]